MEHMPQKWFGIIEEDKDKEETLYSCNLTVVNIVFQEASIQIRQNEWTKNYAISKYCL